MKLIQTATEIERITRYGRCPICHEPRFVETTVSEIYECGLLGGMPSMAPTFVTTGHRLTCPKGHYDGAYIGHDTR